MEERTKGRAGTAHRKKRAMATKRGTKKTDEKRTAKKTRVQQRDAMLKAALARPGVREFMEVYQGWQKADRGLDAYRSATKEPLITTTTDRTSVRSSQLRNL